jgi:hypothetical protein
MSFVSQPHHSAATAADARDTYDQVLAITWIVSEIAVDVFGMLFWSALVLGLLKAG